MAKLVKIIVKNCAQCPYHEYDPNYGMSYNSGYDCNNSGKRIVNDGYLESNNLHLDELPIPDWCKLVEVDELTLSRKEKINKLLKR